MIISFLDGRDKQVALSTTPGDPTQAIICYSKPLDPLSYLTNSGHGSPKSFGTMQQKDRSPQEYHTCSVLELQSSVEDSPWHARHLLLSAALTAPEKWAKWMHMEPGLSGVVKVREEDRRFGPRVH